MIVVRTNSERLEKAKYIKRWKGKDGKYKYLYKKPSSSVKESNEQISDRLINLIKRVSYTPEKIGDSYLLRDKFGRKIEITEKEYNQGKEYIAGGMTSVEKNGNYPKTKSFKDWFSGSKALDDKGNPIVVYHGSTKKLDEISPGYDEVGAWFTTSQKTASNYVKGDDGHLHSLYISAKNPLVADFSNIKGDSIEIDGQEFGDNESIAKYAESNGYDSLQFPVGNFTEDDETWVVFDSTQIKSTDNVGSFDKNNPDIRKSKLVIGMKAAHQKLADKHGESLEKIEKELKIGQKEEMEHTSDPIEAHKIAMDHLNERADYYKKMEESGLMEKSKDPKKAKFETVMREFHAGTLKSSTGGIVTDKKQALAIAYSESGMSKSIIQKAKEVFSHKIVTFGELKKLGNPPAEYDRKYKLQGRKKFHGLDIAIENKKGSYREGKDPNGKKWKTFMNFDYGRIGGTKAVDDEAQDIYLGPDEDAKFVYVVHQNDPFTGKYDECKSMCGFPSKESAIEGYLSQYNRPDFLGPVSTFTIKEFKDALKEKKGAMLYNSDLKVRGMEKAKKTRIIVRRR